MSKKISPSARLKAIEKCQPSFTNKLDFSNFNPKSATPGLIRNFTKRAIDKRRSYGSPLPQGHLEFKKSIANWIYNRFDIELDPKTQICATSGIKESIFTLTQTFIDPGDIVILPNPCSRDIIQATKFVGANIHFMPLEEENFEPDLTLIPDKIAVKAKLLWLSYPDPTSTYPSESFLNKLSQFCTKNNIIIASMEQFSELYTSLKPNSILQTSAKGTICLNSLSHRSSMHGYSIGWIAGDSKIIEHYKKLQSISTSGVPTFLQDTAIAGYSDQNHPEGVRGDCKAKQKLITNALIETNIEFITPQSTAFLWVKCPKELSSEEFHKKLINLDIVVSPGSQFGTQKDYFRFSISPSLDECKIAADKIKKNAKSIPHHNT